METGRRTGGQGRRTGPRTRVEAGSRAGAKAGTGTAIRASNPSCGISPRKWPPNRVLARIDPLGRASETRDLAFCRKRLPRGLTNPAFSCQNAVSWPFFGPYRARVRRRARRVRLIRLTRPTHFPRPARPTRLAQPASEARPSQGEPSQLHPSTRRPTARSAPSRLRRLRTSRLLRPNRKRDKQGHRTSARPPSIARTESPFACASSNAVTSVIARKPPKRTLRGLPQSTGIREGGRERTPREKAAASARPNRQAARRARRAPSARPARRT